MSGTAWDQIAGNWKQVRGMVREQWGQFTDNDLEIVAGKRDRFLGKLQERYGMTPDDAEQQVQKFERSVFEQIDKMKETFQHIFKEER